MRNNEKFVNAQVPKTKSFAPRPGYFFIKSTSYKEVKPFGQILMAQVNWKDKLNSAFIEDAVFEIVLSNLSSAKPQETANLLQDDLNGKVIYVYSPAFVPKTFNGEQKQVLSCQWHFIHETPTFINKQNVLSYVFIEKDANRDYYQDLLENASYDVLEALEYEATLGYSGDVPIEDVGDNFDSYDGDIDNESDEQTDPDSPEDK